MILLGLILKNWCHQYDVIIGSLQRPSNFDVSQCIKSKFSDLEYFDLFFQKCYLFSNLRLV